MARWIASIPAGTLLDEDDEDSGQTRLETLGRDPLPGGWQENTGVHAQRVLALFGL